MRLRPLSFALVFAASLLGTFAQADAPAPVPSRVALVAETTRLSNGLTVILHEDHRTPIVAVNVYYNVGSKDEPAGKNGFAHLFEHVMFKGSRNVPPGMFDKYLMRAGTSETNGTTNTDRTAYYETLPQNELALALWLEADRMGFLLDRLDQQSFAREREVVKNERLQRYDNVPYGLVNPVLIRGALYPVGHPYHLATIGTPEDLDRASLDDVRAFFKRFYVPNNATLVIAGDIDKAKTRALVETYFGPLSRGADPGVVTEHRPVTLTATRRLAIEAGVELPKLLITWPTVPRHTSGDTELEMLASVLSRGKSSRLYKRLVYDLQIAQDVSADQDGTLLAGAFQISATLKEVKSIEVALKEIDAELAKLRKSGPSQDEVTRARAGIVPNLLFGLESVTTRANALNSFHLMTGDANYLGKHLASYEAVGTGDLQRAAQSYLPEGKRIIAVVTPKAGAPKAGHLVSGSTP